MPFVSADPRLASLLAEAQWLRELARRLVRCEHDAADLVQDTLHTALLQPPAAERPLRGWLRTVLLHRWRDRVRERNARAAREQRLAAVAADAPASGDVVQRAESHRALVDAVLALDEPYRTCVLLRFFEHMPPRAIAARTGAPLATVHSRLQRALAMLRARLASTHGPSWRRAVAPLLVTSPFALLLGAPLVHTTAKSALAAAVLLAVALPWAWPARGPAAPAGAAATPPAQPVAAATPADAAAPGAAAAERRAVPDPGGDRAPATTTLRSAHGRVLDARGTAVAGVALRLDGANGATATSGVDGTFTLPVERTGTVASVDPRWSTVLEGIARMRGEHPCTVVVAPRIDLAGRVVDAAGAPVPAAAVSARMPAQLGADLGVVLDLSTPRQWRAVCDGDGRFRLDDVPLVAAASLCAELGGYLPRIEPLPAAATALLELVLERPAGGARVVDGLVVDRWGAAVAGARVSAGDAVARSDARGAFTLELTSPRLGTRLVAVAAGAQPAMLEPERDAAGQPSWPRRVVLRLGDPPRAIAGRVERADGEPAAGVRVWIADPTFVGVEDDVVIAENAVLGGERPFWAFTRSGADGTFRLDGLAARAYTVRALDEATLSACTVAGVAAGSDGVALRLTDELLPRLCVVVATRGGVPVPGVRVQVQRPALELAVPGGTRDEWANAQAAVTDADGAVTFRDVPVGVGVEVFASGDRIMFAGRKVERGVDAEHFVLTVDRRMHLQVEVSPPSDRGDQCRVLDEHGQPMLLRIMRGDSSRTGRSARVVDGKSHVLSLAEGARTVVLLRGDIEVARLPVQLVEGQVTTVRF
jgi:RNA polymerase sigma factor (sigma-70 family)